ncbi:hypothetical protein L915_05051 [Phytophthora nicotianae]|uniref:Uncharacterized protein n=1 Tax=Phytophthora nicotianae TaxID=4792 RepID=W2H9R9_PHYNI|nr:hypothetical protein L915_05051 [Phytophthora nicotianae]
MDFFNKAKEALSGGSDSSKKDDKKDSDSIFTKAMGAVEKYQVKEKAVEYAQKQVAKREEEKHQPGYVEKKDKSIIDKAKEAAEDFLAKQGDKPKENPVSKPAESRSRSSSSSSSSSSDSEKERLKGSQNPPVVVQQGIPPSTEANINGSFGRMNLESENPSSSSKYETYQEYWSRRGAVDSSETRPSYTQSPPLYPPGVENSSSYYQSEREALSYDDRNYQGGNYASGQYQNAAEYYPSGGERNFDDRSYPRGSDSQRYQGSEEYGRSGGEGNYPSYSNEPASGYGQMGGTYGNSMPYRNYTSNDHV